MQLLLRILVYLLYIKIPAFVVLSLIQSLVLDETYLFFLYSQRMICRIFSIQLPIVSILY